MSDDDRSSDDEGIVSIDLSVPERRLARVQSTQRQSLSSWLEQMQRNNQVPPPDEHVGASQRLTMSIPTSGQPTGTVISAGKGGPSSFDGYAVKTIGHVAMSAEGGVSASTMTLQANGQIMVQSDQASLFLLSTAPATLASSSVTNVAGAGVVIAAGGGAPVAMVPIGTGGGGGGGGGSGGADTPSSVESAADAASAASDAWGGWDAAISEATDARDALRRTMDPARATAFAAPQAGPDAQSSLVDANQAGATSDAGAGGLVLHGEKSVLVGTPGALSVRAGESLTMSSHTVAMIAEEDAELVAARNWSATVSGNSSVLTKGRVDVVSHEGVLHVASRTGEAVEVQAQAIAVGEIAPSEPQLETRSVHVRAKTHVGLATDVDPSRANADAGIHLDSHSVIEARSASAVTIQAADTVTLRIGDQEIDLVVDKQGKIELRAKSAKLALADRDGIGVEHRGVPLIKGTSSRVTVGTSPSDKLEIASGSVALKGGSIKIG